MSLKISDLVKPMLKAAQDSLADDWPKAKEYGAMEFPRLARSLVDIARLAADGRVNRQQARALARIHRNTALMVLLTIEGLGIIAVENAVNAALRAVGDAVNAAAGVSLL